ncbi:unnamed protein product [Hymenolepis diminuta]|uniref:Uncharacterized protein n=1 Tax=Hymenolepis diminuta TaxID=6216 RepID=A0A564Z6M9_HYMDI|nr:unnamed protein product [Hymenolepis diminuta]
MGTITNEIEESSTLDFAQTSKKISTEKADLKISTFPAEYEFALSDKNPRTPTPWTDFKVSIN